MDKRWENGSDFHHVEFVESRDRDLHPWEQGRYRYYGSGRDALRALIEYGAGKLDWKRVFLPAYYCQEVVSSLENYGLHIERYDHSPLNDPVWPTDCGSRDAIIIVNFFGLKKRMCTEVLRSRKIWVIEDHTHDPLSKWAEGRNPDFCIASLRKTLPIADGGVLWSPNGSDLPEEVEITPTRLRAAELKRLGMSLKAKYISGNAGISKEMYRGLLVEGESRIAMGDISGISGASREFLDKYCLKSWRYQRMKNFSRIVTELNGLMRSRIMMPDEGCVPFGLIINTESAHERNTLRTRLIAERIYPAILWPLDLTVEVSRTIAKKYNDLSRRLLFVHCDGRYVEEDMLTIAKTMNRDEV